MTIEFAAKSDMGRVRTNNEDAFGLYDKQGLFIVADGMGGHNSGEVASRMAVDIIGKNFARAMARQEESDRTQVMVGSSDPALSPSANHLVSSIRLANQAIFEASATYPQNQGMGTTLVAVLVQERSYVIAWVGDSRIYLARHNQLQQLSTDHSLVQEQIAKGLITAEQAETSQFKNVLTRALGSAETVNVDVAEIPLFDNDYVLLCTDGLTRMLNDADILETVQSRQKPQDICDSLVALANDAGGRDNVTVVAVHPRTEKLWDKLLKAVSKTS